MEPGQGPGLCTKAHIGRNVTRTGSGTGFQAWYGTKWGQGRVMYCGPRPVLDEMGRGQDQGLAQLGPGQSQGLGTKTGIGRDGARTGSGSGAQRPVLDEIEAGHGQGLDP